MSAHSIKRLPTQKPTLYAFEVSGKITKPDIERMADELVIAFEEHGVVDVIILIKDWDGIELGAVDVAPDQPSFITGLCSPCGPIWTGLQTR
jgi:hypothetical protein